MLENGPNRFLKLKQYSFREKYEKWSINKFGTVLNIYDLDLDSKSHVYNQSIQIVKEIIKSDDEELRAYLWNNVSFHYYRNDMDHDDLLEILDFVEKQEKQESIGDLSYNNINTPIEGDRIKLIPNTGEYTEKFYEHYKNDDMFTIFTGDKYADPASYIPLNRTFVFIIIDINTNSPIGYIQLYNYNIDTKTAELTYYIFKEYRNKGYAKEAVSLLTDYALNNKLVCYQETIYKYIYDKKIAPIELIYANTSSNNVGSIKLLESLGFENVGISHRTFAYSENEYIDSYRYELIKK